jgi:hypothetical protein
MVIHLENPRRRFSATNTIVKSRRRKVPSYRQFPHPLSTSPVVIDFGGFDRGLSGTIQSKAGRSYFYVSSILLCV